MRRWLSQRTPNTLVGLDIQPETIKLLEINAHDGANRIENFAITSVPVGAIIKDEVKDAAVIANTLRELFRDHNIKSKNVALAIRVPLRLSKYHGRQPSQFFRNRIACVD